MRVCVNWSDAIDATMGVAMHGVAMCGCGAFVAGRAAGMWGYGPRRRLLRCGETLSSF